MIKAGTLCVVITFAFVVLVEAVGLMYTELRNGRAILSLFSRQLERNNVEEARQVQREEEEWIVYYRETVMRLLYSFVRYVTVIAVFYFGLGYLGFSTGTIIASLGILDIPSGKLTAVNAGHEYPVLKTPEGMYELIKDKHGIAVGIMEGAKYREYEWELTPGSSLFVYTDGLPEANNAEEKLYGVERMLAALNGVPEAGPEELLKSVRASVDAFVGEAPQFDDLTMLCLRYHGTAK